MERKNGTLNCRGTALDLTTPVIMGIINITDDSFYAGSRTQQMDRILEKAAQHLDEGAQVLDIGAQSSRPGAVDVGADVEIERLLPAVEALVKRYPQVIISIDTYYAKVAEQTINAGAAIINDISAGDIDPDMLSTAGRLKAPYIAMHMQGTPGTMQRNPQYQNVVTDVLDYFIQKKAACLAAGINDLIIDPGFGFGKTMAHNYALLKHMAAFQILDCPLLVGISRKSMIYKLLENTPADALNGTTVLNTIALQQGAAILRVHDVKAAAEVVKIWKYMQKA